MVSVLDRKLWRDLLRMWAQVLAIAMVMACGVATILIAIGSYRSLEETRSAFYDRYRFATVFAGLTRAPLHLRDAITRIEGVSGVELRIVRPALLDIAGMAEPATGLAISIPDRGEAAVNRLYLRSGRLPEPGRAGEVAVTEPFARAHRMIAGSTFDAIMNGRKRTLTVTGIMLSPEFIYAVGPGDMLPDERRFGVFFMPRSALAGLFEMDGAFNDVVLRTRRDADLSAVIDALDTIVKPFGGTGAYDRTDQLSHAFLDHELIQLQAMAAVIPPVFLFVSAFLVNMVLSRLIALEREQIGLLKAVGYGRLSYCLALCQAYTRHIRYRIDLWLRSRFLARDRSDARLRRILFLSLPDLSAKPGSLCDRVRCCGHRGARGRGQGHLVVVVLPPAVAMQPPAPTRYRSLFAGGAGYIKGMSQLTVMALASYRPLAGANIADRVRNVARRWRCWSWRCSPSIRWRS